MSSELRGADHPKDQAAHHQQPEQSDRRRAQPGRDRRGSPSWRSSNDLIVLADEIYAEILYEGEHVSIATMPGMKERTIILDGFSKTYAMTGWRLGYGAMPEEFAQVSTS